MWKDERIVTEGPTRCETLGLCCSTRESRCKHINTYDFHYHYCGALPDTSPQLRPSGGSRCKMGRDPRVEPRGRE